MAQSVNLWGATYSDVPAIEVPKSGGGMASFTDVTDTTAVASDVAQGKYFFTASGQLTLGTASGGGGGSVTQDQDGYIVLPSTGGGGSPSATQHEIHLEFSDSTDTDIDVYYDDALISTMITAYEPTTYGQKTVDSASLDGVVWYTKSTETWETVFNGSTNLIPDTPYPYWWIADLSAVSIVVGSVWKVSIDGGTEYRLTATDQSVSGYGQMIGNPLYSGGQDDGSGVPFNFFNAGWGAWSGGADTTYTTGTHLVKIERLVTE